MKSLTLMGFAACVVVPMTWAVDTLLHPCEIKNCGPNEECRLMTRGDAVMARCVSPLSKDEGNQRIVGGSKATYGDHPYICSLQIYTTEGWAHNCGCTIWNDNFVVSAAHCFVYLHESMYRVIVGEYDLSNLDTYQVPLNLSNYTMHPRYVFDESQGLPNDIAVARLESPITFNGHVNKATFASSGSFVGDSCVLTGWGLTSSELALSTNELQSVNMTAMRNSDCASSWSPYPILDGHICFYEKIGLSVCRGDSGGPAVCGQYVTGITSMTDRSCSGKFPSIYTRVSYYYDWLVSQAGSN